MCGFMAGVGYYFASETEYRKEKMDGMYCLHCHLKKKIIKGCE